MTTGDQLNVLDGFKRNKFNILVATNVVEEGMDVRACNIVIKADELTNYRSFIQSQVSHFACLICGLTLYVKKNLQKVPLEYIKLCLTISVVFCHKELVNKLSILSFLHSLIGYRKLCLKINSMLIISRNRMDLVINFFSS